jgi:transposase
MLRKLVVWERSAVDEVVFNALVPPDHKLRSVLAAVDFESFRDELAGFYSPGMGRPGDPVVMVKVVFLQFFYCLSDRQVIERLRTDAAFRWFLGLGLGDRPPNYSTLSIFRSRLGVEGTQRVMDGLIRQCRDQGLLKYRLRLKDATHVLADVAIPATLTLLAESRNQLLSAARPFAPDLVAAAEARMVEIRAATQNGQDGERMIPRVALLREILAWAIQVQRPAGADERAWTRFEKARALAQTIVGEAEDPEAGDRTRSVHDSDARRGKHGEYFDGYLVDLMMDADSEIITSVNLLPANGAEGADAVTLIRHEESVTGKDVAAISIDGAGFDGKLLRELQDPQDLNMEVYVPYKEPTTPEGFSPVDFIEDPECQTVTCPNGQTSKYRQREETRNATIYRFTRETCEGCPFRDRCLGRVPKGPFGRSVRKNDYEPEHQAVRAKMATQEYIAVKKEHPKIERKLSEMVRRHGARRARYRGLLKVLCQQLWTALTVNIKRMVVIGASARVAAN